METMVLEHGCGTYLVNQASVITADQAQQLDLAAVPENSPWTQATQGASNPYITWVAGDFVEADRPNSNKQFWTAGDLEMAEYSIRYAPLNMAHKFKTPVGFFAATNVVKLAHPRAVASQLASASSGVIAMPTVPGGLKIQALSGMWSHIFPEEAAQVVAASEADSLFFCADTATEMLTRTGWKRYHQVDVGEECLVLDDDGFSRWGRVEAMNYFFVRDQKMISLEGRMHSSLTTPNHRWLVRQRGGADCRDPYLTWRTSETLTRSSHILYSAPHVSDVVEAKYSDAFVELVAWYWTEGTRSSGAVISQSHAANPRYVQRIRAALTGLYGAPARVRDGGLWYETRRDRMTMFHLCKAAAQPLFEVVPRADMVVDETFLSQLTTAQLRLYIETSIDADGSRAAADGQIAITQVNEARIRSFEVACALAGQATNTQQTYTGKDKVTAWRTCLVRRAVDFSPKRLASLGKGFTQQEVSYTGIVWCPTTSSGTFLARRRGSVYWTGNSMECRGSHLRCAGATGCGNTFEYLDVSSHCAHLMERSSVRHIINPTFRGGALLVPPVRPGWRNAHASVLTNAVMTEAAAFAAQHEEQYRSVASDGGMTTSAWEQLMGLVIASASR